MYPLFLKSWWGQKEEESPTTRFLRHLRLLRPARHGGLSHTNSNPQTCLRTPHTTGAAAANDRTATSVKRSVTGQTHATMTKPSERPLSSSACEQAMHSTLSTRLYAIFVHGIYTFKPLVHSLNESAQMKIKVCCIYGIWMLWRWDIFLLSILFCVFRTLFTALYWLI